MTPFNPLDLKSRRPEEEWQIPRRSAAFFKIEVKVRPDGEKAAHTLELIRKGSTVFRDGGILVDSVKEIPDQYTFAVLFSEGLYLVPSDFREPICYLNHSCESNLKRVGGLVYVARRDIEPGEELSLEYTTLVAGHPDWKLNCYCGSTKCRKIIKGDDWRNPEFFHSFYEEWLPHIQKIGPS